MTEKREWLKNIRIAHGFTQQEVADAVGVERSTYAMYESGRRNPHPDKAQELGSLLKFDWTFFFARKCGVKPQSKNSA